MSAYHQVSKVNFQWNANIDATVWLNIGDFTSFVRLSVEIDVISLFLQIDAIETNKNTRQHQND